MKQLAPFAINWPDLSQLLDEALALSADERAAWLDGLAGDQAAHRETLRELLRHEAAIETGNFLDKLPHIRVPEAILRPHSPQAVMSASTG